MSEEYINELYKKAKLIPKLRELIEYCCIQDGFYANKTWKEIAPTLAQVCSENASLLKISLEESKLYKAVLSVIDAESDLCLIGSIAESKIIPELEKFLESSLIDTETESGRYRITSSKSGFLTAFDNSRNVYLNSPIDPVTESAKLARYIYKPDYERFVLLGCGMGYLASELYKLSDGTLDIILYEDDPEIISYAFSYGALSDIPEEKLSVLSGENEEETVSAFIDDNGSINSPTGKYAFWWYLTGSKSNKKNDLARENLKVNVLNRDNLKFEINYYRNIRNVTGLATEIPEKYGVKKEWVVVAGGPSIDDNIEFIKESSGKRTTLVASTSFNRMTKEGITPDFIVASEPGKATFKYFDNLLDHEIPLIIAPFLYWKCAEYYKGVKYLAPIAANSAMAIKLYKQNVPDWRSGYTVTVLAVECAIRLGAKKVYLIGADFAYPGGFTHASGTAYREKVTAQTFGVESVDGGMVQTSDDLNMFRLELEKLLTNYPDVEVINMSRHGAKIKGTKI